MTSSSLRIPIINTLSARIRLESTRAFRLRTVLCPSKVIRQENVGSIGKKNSPAIMAYCFVSRVLHDTHVDGEKRGKLFSAAFGRLLPRTQREFRRHFLNDWRYALKIAQGRPKYHVDNPDLRVFVISLERVPERKLSVEIFALWVIYDP